MGSYEGGDEHGNEAHGCVDKRETLVFGYRNYILIVLPQFEQQISSFTELLTVT